jgi:hypothetical protein
MILLTGCGTSKGKVRSNLVIDTAHSMSMRIKTGSLTSKGMVLVVENLIQDDNIVIVGGVDDDYHLEYQSGGKWYYVESLIEEYYVALLGKYYKDTIEQQINWETRYGTLSDGKYRLVKAFTEEKREDGKSVTQKEKFWLAVEFEIE